MLGSSSPRVSQRLLPKTEADPTGVCHEPSLVLPLKTGIAPIPLLRMLLPVAATTKISDCSPQKWKYPLFPSLKRNSQIYLCCPSREIALPVSAKTKTYICSLRTIEIAPSSLPKREQPDLCLFPKHENCRYFPSYKGALKPPYPSYQSPLKNIVKKH